MAIFDVFYRSFVNSFLVCITRRALGRMDKMQVLYSFSLVEIEILDFHMRLSRFCIATLHSCLCQRLWVLSSFPFDIQWAWHIFLQVTCLLNNRKCQYTTQQYSIIQTRLTSETPLSTAIESRPKLSKSDFDSVHNGRTRTLWLKLVKYSITSVTGVPSN